MCTSLRTLDAFDPSTKDFECLFSELGLVIRETSEQCGSLCMHDIMGEGYE